MSWKLIKTFAPSLYHPPAASASESKGKARDDEIKMARKNKAEQVQKKRLWQAWTNFEDSVGCAMCPFFRWGWRFFRQSRSKSFMRRAKQTKRRISTTKEIGKDPWIWVFSIFGMGKLFSCRSCCATLETESNNRFELSKFQLQSLLLSLHPSFSTLFFHSLSTPTTSLEHFSKA